jgi:hypothetical protein
MEGDEPPGRVEYRHIEVERAGSFNWAQQACGDLRLSMRVTCPPPEPRADSG